MSEKALTLYETAAGLENGAAFFGGRRVSHISAELAFEFFDGCVLTAELPREHERYFRLSEHWSRDGMNLTQWDGSRISAVSRFAPVEMPKGAAVLTWEGETRRLNYTVRAGDIEVFFAKAKRRRVHRLAHELAIPLEYAEALVGGAV